MIQVLESGMLASLQKYLHPMSLIFSIGCWIVILTFSLLAWYLTSTKCKPANELKDSKKLTFTSFPKVSVLRPLHGLDFKLLNNLESSFLQDYPHFELIFSVRSMSDPSIEVVEKLMEKYPKVDTKLVLDEKEYGSNPKINNLVKAFSLAKYEMIWVCDSNIYLNPGCLSRSIFKFQSDDKIGLIHHLPVAIQARSFGAMLDTLFMNTCHAKQYTLINQLNLACCVVGKSCIYRKEVLDKFGGLVSASQYLAEDYFLANQVLNSGYTHAMVQDLVYQPVGNIPLLAFFQRRSRWIRLRKYVNLTSLILEPLSDCVINGLIASYGFSTVFKVHPLNFFAFHTVVWFLIDLMIFQSLQGTPIYNLNKFMVAWGFQKLTAFPLLVYSIAGSNLCWRGTTYIITKDTKVLEARKSSLPITSTGVVISNQTVLSNVFIRYVITTALYGIKLVAEILYKSQRNGSKQTEPEKLKVVTKGLLTNFLLDDEDLSPTSSNPSTTIPSPLDNSCKALS